MKPIQSSETEITGAWIVSNDQVVADDSCKRIEWLVQNQLQRLAVASSGWDTLFRDPSDGRYWEHTFPQAESHGGGPPQLRLILKEVATTKYGL